jgi:5-methylcytosine-specific restriction endonuclease McrA
MKDGNENTRNGGIKMTTTRHLCRTGKGLGRKKLCERYAEYWEKYLKEYKPEEYSLYLKNLQYKNSQNKRAKKALKGFKAFKVGWSCAICGYSKYPESLDFHHIIPDDKKFCLNRNTFSYNDFGDELQKCICLCANCHRHITTLERQKV